MSNRRAWLVLIAALFAMFALIALFGPAEAKRPPETSCKGRSCSGPPPTVTASPSPSPTRTPSPTPSPTPVPSGPVRAAVIDSGCQWEHTSLQGRINIAAGYTAPWLLNPNVGLGQDDSFDGHGTKVCGIVAGAARDIAGQPLGGGTTDVVPIKAFSAFGQCADVAGPDVDGMVAAIQYATASGARVVNISCTSRLYSQSIQDAVDAGSAAGVLFVVAAGNSGTFTDADYPTGARSNMLVVGGIGQQSTRSSYVDVVADDSGTISTSCVHDFVNAGLAPCDVTWNANQLGIPVGTPYYEAGSGTSFAAALATHTVIAMFAVKPSLTAAQAEAIIRLSAIPVPSCAVGCGAGYLNPAGAVAAAGP